MRSVGQSSKSPSVPERSGTTVICRRSKSQLSNLPASLGFGTHILSPRSVYAQIVKIHFVCQRRRARAVTGTGRRSAGAGGRRSRGRARSRRPGRRAGRTRRAGRARGSTGGSMQTGQFDDHVRRVRCGRERIREQVPPSRRARIFGHSIRLTRLLDNHLRVL